MTAPDKLFDGTLPLGVLQEIAAAPTGQRIVKQIRVSNPPLGRPPVLQSIGGLCWGAPGVIYGTANANNSGGGYVFMIDYNTPNPTPVIIAGSQHQSAHTDNADGSVARFLSNIAAPGQVLTGIAYDAGRNCLYVGTGSGYRVRKISLVAPYAVTTIAGTGASGVSDNANGTLATLTTVFSLAMVGANSLYVGCRNAGNNALRLIDLNSANNAVSTPASQGGYNNANAITSMSVASDNLGIWLGVSDVQAGNSVSESYLYLFDVVAGTKAYIGGTNVSFGGTALNENTAFSAGLTQQGIFGPQDSSIFGVVSDVVGNGAPCMAAHPTNPKKVFQGADYQGATAVGATGIREWTYAGSLASPGAITWLSVVGRANYNEAGNSINAITPLPQILDGFSTAARMPSTSAIQSVPNAQGYYLVICRYFSAGADEIWVFNWKTGAAFRLNSTYQAGINGPWNSGGAVDNLTNARFAPGQMGARNTVSVSIYLRPAAAGGHDENQCIYRDQRVVAGGTLFLDEALTLKTGDKLFAVCENGNPHVDVSALAVT